MATASRWTMRIEPYDPDARDADNDGIIQEGTAWERPAGTRLVDELGRAITRGSSSERRPRGLRVVDQQGNPVDYTPTYERAGSRLGAGGGTALGEAGALSLRERGLPALRDLTAPRVAAVQPEPTPEAPEIRSERISKVQQRNKDVIDKISESGGSWARVDEAFLEKDAERDQYHHVTIPLTPEEAAEQRRDRARQELLAFQHFLRTGKSPTEEDGFPLWVAEKYKYSEGWQQAVDRMPDDLRKHVAETSPDDLIAEAEGYALEFHDGLTAPSVRVPVDRVDSLIEDGRYKTTHEARSKHSGTRERQEFERNLGIPDEAPVEVRPASGYVTHEDIVEAAKKKYLEEKGYEATEFSALDIDEGAVDIYGDIELVLDKDIAGRTAYGRGDSLNNQSRPARLDTDNPDEIANAVLGTGGMNRGQQLDVMLSFIHAGRSGSYADVTNQKSWQEFPEGTGKTNEYVEALVAGSFDLDEVAEVRLHPKSRDASGVHRSLTPVLGHENGAALMEATRSEFYSPEALAGAGLTPEELAFIEANDLLKIDGPEPRQWPGGSQIEPLYSHRKAAELEEKFKKAGVGKVVHTHENGLDIMDPKNYGDDAGIGTAEQIREERLRRKIVEDLRAAIDKKKNPSAGPYIDPANIG